MYDIIKEIFSFCLFNMIIDHLECASLEHLYVCLSILMIAFQYYSHLTLKAINEFISDLT